MEMNYCEHKLSIILKPFLIELCSQKRFKDFFFNSGHYSIGWGSWKNKWVISKFRLFVYIFVILNLNSFFFIVEQHVLLVKPENISECVFCESTKNSQYFRRHVDFIWSYILLQTELKRLKPLNSISIISW